MAAQEAQIVEEAVAAATWTRRKWAAQEAQIVVEAAAAAAEARMPKRSAKERWDGGQRGHLDAPSFYETHQLFKKEQ